MRQLGIIPLLLACTGENVIEKQANIAPNVLIASHSDGAEVEDGYVENFRATVTDEDNDFDELQIAWYVGDNLVCDWTEASPAGESMCAITFGADDSNVIVEVRDPAGAGGRDEISIVVLPTDAPSASIVTPLASGNYYSSELIQFSGLVGDSEDDLSELTITWTSNIDGALPLTTTPDSSGEISDYGYLSEGQHAIELRVEDTSGKVTTDEVVLRVGGENSIPSCAINAPANLDTFVQGDTIIFTGTATDEDIPANELSVTWNSDKDGDFGSQVPTSNGAINFAYDGLSTNTHTITLTVSDEIGSVCSDQIFLVIGTPPTIAIDAPLDGDVYSVGESIVFRSNVSDTEDQVNNLQVTWTSSLDGEISNANANSQGVSQFSRNNLSAGVHSISASVSDSSGLLADDLITIRVNNPPTAPVITLSPDPAYGSNTLTANVSGSLDADGDNVSFAYAWYENSIITAYTGSSVPASELSAGEIWTVRVTPSDPYSTGNYAEASITISNSLPVLSSVTISPSNNVYNDSTLTCLGTATDADQSITPTFSWDIDGTIVQGSTVDLSTMPVSPGASATCTVTATDNQGATVSDSSSVTVGNRYPTISNANIAPSPLLGNSTATCAATVADPDGENTTVDYEWLIAGNYAASGASLNLTGLVSPSDAVECVITVTDASGLNTVDTVSSMVQNTPPVIDNSSLTPSNPTRVDTVTCQASASDLDGETVALTFAFADSSGNAYTATSTTSSSATLDLSGTSIAINTDLTCTITATDASGSSANTTETVTVINSAPSFDVPATISPSLGIADGVAMTCSAHAIDATDPNVVLTYDWTVGGLSVATGPNYTASAADASVGQQITCTVTATDLDGESSTSVANVTMNNSAPSVTPPVITPNTGVYNDSVLDCSSTASDAEESVSLNVEWLVNGTSFASGNTVDLGVYSIAVGDSITCTVSTSDSYGAAASDSVTVGIDNRAPADPTLSLNSTAPVEGVDDIVCSITSPTVDADGESLSYAFGWTVDGVSYVTPTNTPTTSTVPNADITFGEEWICMARASDGLAQSNFTSISATVVAPFNAVEFHNCSQSGNTGPSQSQCNSAYSGSDLDGAVTVSNGIQTWTVPYDGTYSIEAFGAEGGMSTGQSGGGLWYGGQGSYIYGEFALSAGDQLKIQVGQQGQNSNCGSGGGGGTFVHNGSQLLLVAGGGGGGFHCNALGGRYGGDGQTGTSGGAGVCSPQRPSNAGGTNGNGGTSSSFGTGGSGYLSGGTGGCSMSAYPANGGISGGGFGGGGCYHGSCCGNSGAGGGYSGGSLGTSDGCAGGGGGSYNIGANPTAVSGFNSGHGSVVVSLVSMN